MKAIQHPSTSTRFVSLLLAGCCASFWAARAEPAGGHFPLITDGLGNHHRAVSHSSPAAQQYFDEGMLLYYGFARNAAVRAFQEAEALSPDCAMVHWAIALAKGPYINDPTLSDERAAAAWTELQQAEALAPAATPVEQDLIQALAARYRNPAPADRANLEAGFANAMRTVWQRHPQDTDVGVIFAEALMDVRPWDQWTHDGQSQPGTDEAVATLQLVMAIDVTHPYANHLYIHALEASPHPEWALAASDRLLHLQPLLAHNVHMPSHIYIRVGRWQDAIDSNLAAVAAGQRLRALVGSGAKLNGYDAHNEHMLAFAAMMVGQSALAMDHVRAAQALMTPEYSKENPDTADYFSVMPFEVMVRFGRWGQILAEPEAPAPLRFSIAYRHAARAIAFAALDNIPEARREQAAFATAAKAISPDSYFSLNKSVTVAPLITPMIEGEIDLREGRSAEGIAALQEAVRIEDSLNYDEPPAWLIPVRESLGAALLAAHRPVEAEKVYREDLQHFPNNGWSLFGLAKTLATAQRNQEAAAAELAFRSVWAKADLEIDASCLCQSPTVSRPR